MYAKTGEKNCECKDCGKTFRHCGHLKAHTVIHTGEKDYICQHCGKSFSSNDVLKKHIRIHTGEMNYKCEYCGKAFCDNCNLRTHVRVHTGTKPVKCSDCGKTFSVNSTLRRHVRIHTSNKNCSSNESPRNLYPNLNRESANFSQSDSNRMMSSAVRRRSYDVSEISDSFGIVYVDNAVDSNDKAVGSSAENIRIGDPVVPDDVLSKQKCRIAFAVDITDIKSEDIDRKGG